MPFESSGKPSLFSGACLCKGTSPENLHDLFRYDQIKEPVNFIPGTVEPFHHAVAGKKPHWSICVNGKHESPSLFSWFRTDGSN